MFVPCPTCGREHEATADNLKCVDCDVSEMDMLEEMFQRRERFMHHLKRVQKDFPTWPLDLSSKQGQLEVRAATLHSVEELFEALRELKNAKKHRQTEIKDFDRQHFLEEMVDAHNLFLEVLVFVGIGPTEFMEAFRRKDEVIHARLASGY